MKVKNIRLIVFAITVMNISLGRSRLFMRPNFWIMENAKDPKDAVLNLELNSAPEVAALKKDASQDAVGFNLAPPEDAIDLVPTKDAIGYYKLAQPQDANDLVPLQDAVDMKLVPTKDANEFELAPPQDGWDMESGPPQDRVDSMDPVGLKLVPMSLKKIPAPVAQEPHFMVFPKGK